MSEHRTPQSELETTIHTAAEARGILLDPERSAWLEKNANYLQSFDDRPSLRPSFNDPVNDVKVGRTKHSEHFGTTAARLDFTPALEEEGDIIGDAISAKPEHATRFSLMALHGLQNYVLLVDAGIIEKPEILHGTTNAEMAIVAERLGILSDAARRNPGNPALAHNEMRHTSKMEVSGSFDEVSERLFSPESQKLEQILTRRLSAQRLAGTAALVD